MTDEETLKPNPDDETEVSVDTEELPPDPDDAEEEAPRKKRFFKGLPRRTWIAIGCIALALLLCFGLAPLLARGQDRHIQVVRVATFVKAGQRIRESDLQTVAVGGYKLPDGAMRNVSDAVGKYAVSDLYAGDYVFPEKLSESGEGDARTDLLLSGESLALSLSLSSYAAGLSGKLRSGDVYTRFQ